MLDQEDKAESENLGEKSGVYVDMGKQEDRGEQSTEIKETQEATV